MADEPEKQKDPPVVERLVRETGITTDQARELVSLIGSHWASLVFHARALKHK